MTKITIEQITERISPSGTEYSVFYTSGRCMNKTAVSRTMKDFMAKANKEQRMVIEGTGAVNVYTKGESVSKPAKEPISKPTGEYSTSIRNKISRHNGTHFEDMITAACKMYVEEGKAYIQKTPEPHRIIKNVGGGKYLTICEKKAQPDFKGCLSSGCTIVFDAKHTGNDRILQNIVSDEQGKDLDIYSKMEALCYIMVSMNFEHFYLVPWGIWKNMKTIYGHKYMNADDLYEWEVPVRNGNVYFLDYCKYEEE